MPDPKLTIIDRGASSPRITIAVDRGAIDRAKAVLSPGQYRVAMQAAIARNLITVRKNATNEIQKAVKLRDRDIKNAISIKKPTYSNLSASVDITRRPIPLGAFNPQQYLGRMFGANVFRTQKGLVSKAGKKAPKGQERGLLTIQVRPGEPREAIRAGYLFHGRILMRRARAGAPISKRYPLKQAFGPTAAGVAGNAPGLLDRVAEMSAPQLQKDVESQIDRILANPASVAGLVRKAYLAE